MANALSGLLEILDLEDLDVNLFRGCSPQEDRQRVFGGQVAGQALVAASRTVEGHLAHSLQAYFLRPGDPSVPILYQVERIRDGRSFTTRRVTAIQHGEAIFALSASFHRDEVGLEHQLEMPAAPDPDSLRSWDEQMRELRGRDPEAAAWLRRERPIELRYADPAALFEPGKREPRQLVWIRARGRLPDEPLHLHQCVVAYASDLTLLDTALLPHAISWSDDRLMVASLDHAMWFHRPFRADQWLLYAQESPRAAGARGFTMGRLYTRDGDLVVSVVQEGLARPVAPRR